MLYPDFEEDGSDNALTSTNKSLQNPSEEDDLDDIDDPYFVDDDPVLSGIENLSERNEMLLTRGLLSAGCSRTRPKDFIVVYTASASQ